MNRTRTLLTAGAIVALCGSASVVVAQDSVGTSSGTYQNIVGDAVTTHDLNTQCANYVLDLGALTSSWNNVWGVGPLVKSSSAADPLFFNMLMSNQSIAQTIKLDVDRSAEQYADWASAGPGIEPTKNSAPPYSLAGPQGAAQLAYVFSEFGGPNSSQNANIIGGIINWDPASNPGRLYVTRTEAAVANTVNNGPASADFGVGMVDADGNIVVRADAFGKTGPNPLPQQNAFRFLLDSRDCSQINYISSLGGSDASATDYIVANSAQNILVPNMLPEQLAASGNGRLITSDYGSNYIWENPANTPNFSILPELQGATDTRGAFAVSRQTFFANTAATGAALSKPTNGIAYGATSVANANQDTLGISMFGIASDGSVLGTALPICLPWALSSGPGAITDTAPSGIDPNTGVAYSLTSTPLNATTPAEFGHTTGQTSYRGPVSQVGVGKDPVTGEALVGAVVYDQPLGGSSINEGNTLVVARVNLSTSPPTYQWTAAAWNNFDGTATGLQGKDIVDGPGSTNAVARLVPYEVVSQYDLRGLGLGPGPSITPAGFDDQGNIYFVSPIQIKRGQDFDDLNNGNPPPAPLLGTAPNLTPNPERDRFEFGLIRGVLHSTANEFYYELELVMSTGSVFYSPDTNRNYQISYLTITNSGGGFASQAFDSGNVTGGANPNGTPQSQSDPLTLGGLVIECTLTYDVDGLDTVTPNNPNADGSFDYPVEVGGSGPFEDPSSSDPSGSGNAYFPNSTDQSYRGLLFIGNQPSAVGACCIGPDCTDGLSADQCQAAGGTYKGDATLCADVTCETLGACCFGCGPNGSPVVCQNLTLVDCCAANGLYAGDNTDCANSPCDQICQADLNGDGVTNVFDFGTFATNFGTTSGATRCTGDLNCDGIVNVFDFGMFATNFGCQGLAVPNQCCSSP